MEDGGLLIHAPVGGGEAALGAAPRLFLREEEWGGRATARRRVSTWEVTRVWMRATAERRSGGVAVGSERRRVSDARPRQPRYALLPCSPSGRAVRAGCVVGVFWSRTMPSMMTLLAEPGQGSCMTAK